MISKFAIVKNYKVDVSSVSSDKGLILETSAL